MRKPQSIGLRVVVGGILLLLGSTSGWASLPPGGGMAPDAWWPAMNVQSLLTAVGLLVAAPLLAFLALLVRMTSKGPVFYAQDRVGKNGKVFKMCKLRTMVQDAERETGPVWARQDDPRITPLGRWLRQTHLDELPQLLNVLRGEMTLIGPRPERPELVSYLSREIPDYSKRLAVAPGITGLAQVWFKYDETIADVRRKVKYDLLYIRQMCLTADLAILLRTAYVVAVGAGAR